MTGLRAALDTAARLSDVFDTDPVTGKQTGLTRTIRRILKVLEGTGVRYAVIDATALAVRGLPRMTRDLDRTVMIDDGPTVIDTLCRAGLKTVTARRVPSKLSIY